MPLKQYSLRIAFGLTILLGLALQTALWSQQTASAQGRKDFKGAKLEGNQLVVKPGFKLRQAANGRLETFEDDGKPEGPTVRRVTKIIDSINVSCVCGNESGPTYCSTIVKSTGATCKNTSACSGCTMVATE